MVADPCVETRSGTRMVSSTSHASEPLLGAADDTLDSVRVVVEEDGDDSGAG